MSAESDSKIIQGFVEAWWNEQLPVTDETDVSEEIVDYVSSRFANMKYILGLAIDFVVLAQLVATSDPAFRPLTSTQGPDDIFARYPRVTERGGRKSNTLSVKTPNGYAQIRRIEEHVSETFHKLGRPSYPSAYVYNTGQWPKYQDLLVLAFQLSAKQRLATVLRLFQCGLDWMESSHLFLKPVGRPRAFDLVLTEYARKSPGENGGLTLQAIAYAWCSSQFASLAIEADSVRTGSRRRKRIGDIDCYKGVGLEAAVEVKDLEITKANIDRELRQFIEAVEALPIRAVVLAENFSDEASAELRASGVIPLSIHDLRNLVSLWDWYTQDSAVGAMLHFLAHIEQNPGAVRRLAEFLTRIDPRSDHVRTDTYEL